jgi:hypothetical protein
VDDLTKIIERLEALAVVSAERHAAGLPGYIWHPSFVEVMDSMRTARSYSEKREALIRVITAVGSVSIIVDFSSRQKHLYQEDLASIKLLLERMRELQGEAAAASIHPMISGQLRELIGHLSRALQHSCESLARRASEVQALHDRRPS